ncbi:MAG: DUF4388 domain-containing protein [Planctomycetes bacterium]|nr:DUF4388 domain-containing protein [Planctomycetota bacterium]
MSPTPSNPTLWSYARACRRLVAEIRRSQLEVEGGPAVDVEALDPVASCLNEAAELLATMAGTRSNRLPNWLVENVLSTVLDAKEVTWSEGEPPSPKHQQVLSATGDFASTADLISVLGGQRSNGILQIETGTECFQLEFVDGDIVHAQSDECPVGDRLGDILVEQGVVGRDVIEGVLADADGQRLGVALSQLWLVSHEQLLEALEEQIRRQCSRMFTLAPRQYTFWRGPPLRAQQHLRMNTTGLILDSARLADERERIG